MLTAMALLLPIELSDQDKLTILQRLDQFRKWRSLEEKRYCLACGQIIEGHAIQVVGGTRGTGPLRIVCPTRGCHSIPMDWVLPNDEVLSRAAALNRESPPITLEANRGAAPDSSIKSKVRRMATRFRRYASA
jgi:hypothetical protein